MVKKLMKIIKNVGIFLVRILLRSLVRPLIIEEKW